MPSCPDYKLLCARCALPTGACLRMRFYDLVVYLGNIKWQFAHAVIGVCLHVAARHNTIKTAARLFHRERGTV